MTPEQISALAQDVAAWTIRMERTIIDDLAKMIDGGDDIPDFSTAHEFCDANVLGDFEEGCAFFAEKYGHLNSETPSAEFDATRDIFFAIVAEAQKPVAPRMVDGKPRWSNQTDSGQNRLGPSEDRWALRSLTYSGIAEAMADQWS